MSKARSKRVRRVAQPAVTVADAEAPRATPRLYKMAEVVAHVGVEAHILRYWEKEVAQLRPQKSAAGQRRYRLQDLKIFARLRSLIYDEHYTLTGAKKHLAMGLSQRHARLRQMLEELLALALMPLDKR